MTIIHIVMFKFKPTAGEVGIKSICASVLALKNGCLHPTTKQPYIRSLTGGLNNSPEGRNDGLTHAFVVEFDNGGDRDYYVKDDPVHQDFINQHAPNFEKVCVVDYAVGQFD